jgi:proteic killer suppression protein
MYKLYQLSGSEKVAWTVWISGNWRVAYQFEGEDAIIVDYRDYH